MKKNFILLIVLVLIGAFFFWDREREEQQKEREEIEKQIFSIHQDEVKEITVVIGENTFHAVQEGDRWKLVQPFAADGDKMAWDNIANSFTSGKKQRVVEENAANLEPFGLHQPSLSVSLAGVGGATQSTLLFGDSTPTGGKYFALVQGSSDVLTVYSSMYSTADKTLYDFRDKTILDLQADQVQKVEVAHGDTHMTLERRGKDDWQLASPVQARIDKAQITDLINNIRSGQIKQFIEETPESVQAYGLVDPATKLVFWTGDPNNQSSWASRALLIGGTSAAQQWYTKREGQNNVFAVEPKDFVKIPKDIDSLRMKKVTDLRYWEIASVKLTAAGSVITEATKATGEWYLLQPETGKANFSSYSAFVRAIADLEIAAFVQGSTAEFGLDQPDLQIEIAKEDLSDGSAEQPANPKMIGETLALTKEKGENPQYYYGARTNPLEIFGLKIADVDALLEKARSEKPEPVPTMEPTDEADVAETSTP